jgi:transposase
MGRIRKWLSSVFKAKVALHAVKQDKPMAELARTYQIHSVQISQWKRQLLDGVEGFFDNGSAFRRPIPRNSRPSFTVSFRQACKNRPPRGELGGRPAGVRVANGSARGGDGPLAGRSGPIARR